MTTSLDLRVKVSKDDTSCRAEKALDRALEKWMIGDHSPFAAVELSQRPSKRDTSRPKDHLLLERNEAAAGVPPSKASATEVWSSLRTLWSSETVSTAKGAH